MCFVQFQYSKSFFQTKNFINAISAQSHRGSNPIQIFYKKNIFESASHLKNINDFKSSAYSNLQICIAHGRLATIGDSSNNQPLFSHCGNYLISFNGSIFNYREIRQELSDKGIKFNTNGDTEVLLQSFIHWGHKGIKKLNGQFAFIIYDLSREILHLSSDIMGQDTLYYYFDEETISIASEYNAIFKMQPQLKRKIQSDFMFSYLFNNHCPRQINGSTFYANVKMLVPGEWITFDLKTHNLSKFINESVEEYAALNCQVKDLENDIRQASKYVFTSDQKIAVQLSGGIDSTVQAYLATLEKDKDINFYTAKVSDQSNDFRYVTELSNKLNIKLNIVEIPHDNFAMSDFDDLIAINEIPLYLGGPSVSNKHLSNKISNDGNNIVLSGTGGDEIFCGYPRFYRTSMYLSKLYNFNFLEASKFKRDHNDVSIIKPIFKEGFKEIVSRSQLLSTIYAKNIIVPFLEKNFSFCQKDSLKNISKILKDDYSRLGYSINKGIKRVQLKDIKGGAIPTWLHLGDRINMRNTMESRGLFFNKILLKYVNLKNDDKVTDNLWKFTLRTLLHNFNIPEIAWRNDKVGFEWDRSKFIYNNELKIIEHIKSSEILKGVFELDKLISKYNNDKRNNTYRDLLLRCYSLAKLEEIYDLKNI